MPNAITLTSEYCPENKRSFLVTSMFCGFTIDSALGGLVAAQMVAAYGWRSVLVVGGVAPLLLVPVLWLALPASVRFLVLRGTTRTGSPRRCARSRRMPTSGAPASSASASRRARPSGNCSTAACCAARCSCGSPSS
jgi:AAHS family 4-hydroxybenzoate transporter-like MFS transporter